MGTLLNWEDARKNCAKLGGQLAIIRNQAENDAALRLRVGNEYIWLGGSDKKGEGNWKWINNVKISTYFKPRSGYSNWGVGQPDNYQGINQDCLTFWIVFQVGMILIVHQSFHLSVKPLNQYKLISMK